ncbi:MAG: nucleotidyltransferase protein [Ignavibacteria bacterium]|nr:nucleotidyltransferase protein [Ignavibacteria bacterium]
MIVFTKDDAIEITKEFIKQCQKINVVFDRVILFGSLAKDSNNTGADIDLALVSKQFTYDRFDNALMIAPITKNFLDIDAQTFPTDYFYKGDPFIDEILKTGIDIN